MEIICFGDSITRGYDVPYGQGWVEICDASIEGVHFTNYGEDGCSVQGMIYNIEKWLPTAVADSGMLYTLDVMIPLSGESI